MNTKDFSKWIDRIYATKDQELGCEEIQPLLPAYAEAKVEANSFDSFAHNKIEQHLQECSDCSETYSGLDHLLQQELQESPFPTANKSLESETAVFTD